MIGVFDSGYGGLTVFKPLTEKFPKYDFIYLGDNANAPYGSKSQETIYQFTKNAVDWLFKEGCELIILACNTASSQALREIQQTETRKVLGVLIPVAEKVAENNPNIVGVLATEATIKSNAYEKEIHKLAPDIKIISVAAPLLVPMIEGAMIYHSAMERAIKTYLEPFKKQDVKNIVLGCTHYPFIRHLIEKEMSEAEIFDSPSIIPPSLENYLLRHPEIEKKLSLKGSRRYVTTGDREKFSKFAKDFLQIETSPEQDII